MIRKKEIAMELQLSAKVLMRQFAWARSYIVHRDQYIREMYFPIALRRSPSPN